MTPMLNFGGMGALALILVIMHREAIKSFEKQLAEERESNKTQLSEERAANQRLWQAYMDTKIRQHEQLITALVAQDKTLDRILDRLPGGNDPNQERRRGPDPNYRGPERRGNG